MECILDIKKNASTNYAVISEIITYQIEVKNTSSCIVEKVVVKDLLPQELKFIKGSIKVDCKDNQYSNIISGVDLGTILPNEIKIVTFDAEIIKNVNNSIENSAIVEFKYQSKQQANCDCCKSNINVVYIKNPNVTIIKESDKEKVQIDDEITYTITINNDGDLDVENVFLMDKIPTSIELIEGSFSIDGITVNSVELEKGVMLNNIKKYETKIIQYKVKVVSCGSSGKIYNKSKVRYSYTLYNGCTNYKESNESINFVYTALSNFKEVSIDEYLNIPCTNPEIEEINDLNTSVKINKCNIIKTSVAKSSEGQLLSGYKLVVHGTVSQTLEYVADEPTQTVHSAHFSQPFSSYIVLPRNFVIGSKIEAQATVEDTFYRKVNGRCFFENVLILLVAKIRNCN